MISIAYFYTNVDEVREFARKQHFEGEKHFPGKRSSPFFNDDVKKVIQENIRPFAGNVTWWGDEASGAFQITTSNDRSWIHTDNTDWAGVCYLTPDAPLSSGTGLFKHKMSGLRDYKWRTSDQNPESAFFHDYYDMTKWELVDRIGNLYNRLILYRGDLFHCSLDYFGKDLHTGRLFQTFFFNTES